MTEGVRGKRKGERDGNLLGRLCEGVPPEKGVPSGRTPKEKGESDFKSVRRTSAFTERKKRAVPMTQGVDWEQG
eukprot:2688145-Pleurochrysis_carterae.AAC.6